MESGQVSLFGDWPTDPRLKDGTSFPLKKESISVYTVLPRMQVEKAHGSWDMVPPTTVGAAWITVKGDME